MANFVSSIQWDLSQIDLNSYVRNGGDAGLEQGANITFNGQTYPDLFWADEIGGWELNVLGSGIQANSAGEVTQGTVNVVGEIDPANSAILWYAEGLSTSAVAIYNAAQTSSNQDELDLFQSALAGNDTITLSPYDDVMGGFAGDDRITGNGGDDLLDGGSGSDTAIFSTARADATVTFDGDTVVVSTPGEGTDRLTNFEFLSFAGGVYSIASFGSSAPVVDATQTIGTVIGAATDFMVDATDANGDPLAFTAGTPRHGTVTGGADGAFRYTPDAGYLGKDSFDVVVSDGSTSATQTVAVSVSLPIESDWRLIASTGSSVDIGGSGRIFGNTGFQEVSVLDLPGTITFDASFNKGGDVVHLAGDAADWQVVRFGSSAIFSDGDTFVTLPLGSAGLAVAFDDGVRSLHFDTATDEIKIGDQVFGDELVAITAGPDGSSLPTGADPDAASRLLLTEGSEVTAAGVLNIFGTTGSETVTINGGNVTFDPSFNRGGDEVKLDQPAPDFTGARSGSNVVLDSDQTDLVLPIGSQGMILSFTTFAGDERELIFDEAEGAIYIGQQVIDTTPAVLYGIIVDT